MRDEEAAHIDELVRVVAVGEQSTRDAIIHQSWRRWVSEHKFDPVLLCDPCIVTEDCLREQRDALDEFLHTARFGVETLYRQLAGLGYVPLLTDAKGATVNFLGSDLRRLCFFRCRNGFHPCPVTDSWRLGRADRGAPASGAPAIVRS